jgi:hypothetical protein
MFKVYRGSLLEAMNCLTSVIIPDYGVGESADHYKKRKYSLRFVVNHHFNKIILAVIIEPFLSITNFWSKLFY